METSFWFVPICSFLYLQRELPLVQGSRHLRICSWDAKKQTSRAMARWSRPQASTRHRSPTSFSQNNLSPLPGCCHFYRWQSVGRSPPRVTKAVTVRHFHSLSGERQDIFESAAPLSDMAVPKALPITASELEERSGATLQRPICKQNHWETFPTRHHLAATHTCLLYSLAIAVFFFFPSIYRRSPVCPPTRCVL